MSEPQEKHHAKMDYNQITSQIFIGTNFCCKTHMSEELLNKGITTDISLEEERVDSPFGVRSYLWLPTKDGTPPDQYQLRLGVNFLREAVKEGEKIYVHCQNGHGRAPTLVAAFFIKKENLTPKEAIKKIKAKRPEIHPNNSQITALKVFRKNENSS
ncbi:MAG: dual specificity protein phosphatase family protein [Candidatus Magasanikbacteria bacterium]